MLNDLRDVLADLYPEEASARRVASDASLDADYIDMRGSAVSFWHEIIRHAVRKDRISLLVAVALREYPDYKRLIRIQGALEYGKANMNAYIAEPEGGDEDGDLRTIVRRLDRRMEGVFYWLGALSILVVIVLMVQLLRP